MAKDADGNFLPMAKTTGSELAATNAGIALNDKLLLGVIQHGGESGGQASDMMADNGGQLMILQLKLPSFAAGALAEAFFFFCRPKLLPFFAKKGRAGRSSGLLPVSPKERVRYIVHC